MNRLGSRKRLSRRGLLILDEVQKIPDWSEEVKKLWDEEVSKGGGLHVCILGSAQAMKYSGLPAHYATADVPGLRDRYWIEEQWDAARRLAGEQGGRRRLLILEVS